MNSINCIITFVKNWIMISLIFCLILVFDVYIEGRISSPIVSVESGLVQGDSGVDPETKKPYEYFLGIPFGDDTQKSGRLKKPQKVPSWFGVKNATQIGANCPSLVAAGYDAIGLSDRTSEDCLSLNLWVPGSVAENRKNNRSLAVMFYVYGGAFQLGSSEMYPGNQLATYGDVIVVTSNYRVGPSGFLSSGDSSSLGNYGLWDVQLALKWVNTNIRSFGGNPSEVTIFGQSAGGAICSHLLISPAARGLFKRAIILNGGGSGFFGINYHQKIMFDKLAEEEDCDSNLADSRATAECLRKVDPEDLEMSGYMVSFLEGRLPNWVPVVDGDFIPVNPRTAHSRGDSRIYDVITGYNNDDGAVFTLLNAFGLPNDGFPTLVDDIETVDFVVKLVLDYFNNVDSLAQEIYTRFPDLRSEDILRRARAMTNFLTDLLFASVTHFEADAHAGPDRNETDTYFFRYDYRHSFLQYPSWVGASHLDNCYSVFGKPFLNTLREDLLRKQWSETDEKIANQIMSYYINFAKTGNPNYGEKKVLTMWPTYERDNRRMITHNTDSSAAIESDERIEKLAYWFSDKFPLNSSESTKPPIKLERKAAVKKMKLYFRSIFKHNDKAYDFIKNKIDQDIVRKSKRLRMVLF